jgi:hypothetical protein
MRIITFLSVVGLFFLTACTKEEESTPSSSTAKLVFKFQFDSTQARLNNIGHSATIAPGHAAQSPVMTQMGAHYLELAPNAFTALGTGAIVYRAPETNAGGENAIDFRNQKLVGQNEIFAQIPIKDIKPGTYEWLRLSLAFQKGDMKFRVDTTVSGISINQFFTGTLAGFIGFNTYIEQMTIKTQTIPVNGNRKQGFWGFETTLTGGGLSFPYASSGQAPAGSTTVVNPLFASSPIPAGSCVVTASFPGKLTIKGTETADIVVTCSFSTNKSIEWRDPNGNGFWEPLKGEQLVDMGVRGMVLKVN